MQTFCESSDKRFGVSKKDLNLPLLVICAVLFVLGAIASSFSAISLLVPSVSKSLSDAIINSGIRDMESAVVWFAVCAGIRIFFALFCGVYAIGLTLAAVEIAKQDTKLYSYGWRMISMANRVMRWIWIGICAVLGVVFVIRFVPYFISNINNHEGVFYIAGLFLYEGMCLTFFCAAAYTLFRGFGELEDSADCMSYMFTTGKICSLPPTSYAFLFVFGAVASIFAMISRADIFIAVVLLISALAFFVTAIWFKRLKSKIEWIKYQEEKKRIK